jgi:hypothetical protein
MSIYAHVYGFVCVWWELKGLLKLFKRRIKEGNTFSKNNNLKFHFIGAFLL